ncbi:cellulose binding domain-containing protein [Actinoplanes sp. URMC 104]|uniref:cellulose binding domain-containing protein n=1 Tax=Actinoplanes sp. URMC 104 TaxID=3423409 RepID=UPI003F1E2709
MPPFSAALGGAAAALALLVAGPGPAATPAPTPTPACPPALPVSGIPSAVTATSVTISYSILMAPPCGYDPPITVTLFAAAEDARQWQNPVAEAVSGPERYGKVALDGLTPDTTYWFRFSAGDVRDPYATGSVRTAALPVCTATATIGNAWAGGFVATITVRNVNAEPLDAWRVSWRWAGDERLQTLWNGVAEQDGAAVTVRNASYNGAVPPGGSATFGMLVATGTPPGDFVLACDR